jgi:hypothetical protein
LMLCLEPLVLLRLAMLVRDALREGVDTRTFPLPLTRREWRLLRGAVLVHLTFVASAAGMLMQYRESGHGLLTAIEAAMLLRALRDPEVTCSDWERLAYAALLGLCALVGGVGGLTVRKIRPAYLWAWNRACGLPALVQAFLLVCIGAACFELQRPQEENLFTTLAATSGLAGLCCAVGAYVATGSETGWFYLAATVYHVGCALAAAACRLSLEADGPLLNQGHNISFVTLWEQSTDGGERPPGATLMFTSLVLLFLVSVFSIVLFDPDEREAPPSAEADEAAPTAAPAKKKRDDEFAEAAAAVYGGDLAALEAAEAAAAQTRALAGRRARVAALMRRRLGLRSRLGARELQMSGAQLGVSSTGGASGSRPGGGAAAGGSQLSIPPPPQRVKRGPADGDEHMSEREIAEMYDMVTAGGGMMGRKRGVPTQ